MAHWASESHPCTEVSFILICIFRKSTYLTDFLHATAISSTSRSSMLCSLSTEQSISNGRELKTNSPVVSDHCVHALAYFLLSFYCITSIFQVRNSKYFFPVQIKHQHYKLLLETRSSLAKLVLVHAQLIERCFIISAYLRNLILVLWEV